MGNVYQAARAITTGGGVSVWGGRMTLHITGPHGYTGRLAAALAPEAIPVTHSRPADHPLGLQGDLCDPAFARRVAEAASVVVNLVGPFDTYARTLAQACAEAGIDYVDVTGEPHFVAWSRDTLHPIAQRTGARLLHAVATESLPAMLLATEADATDLAFRYRMHLPLMSPGSRITAALSTTRPPVHARDGVLVDLPEADRRQDADDDGVWAATAYPDVVLVPLLGHRNVGCWVHLRRFVDRDGPPPDPDTLWEKHRARPRPGPPEELRRKTEVAITLVQDGVPTHRAVVRDSYRFTAAAAVTVARALAEHPSEGGVRAVPQVLAPEALWADLAPYGLERQVLANAPQRRG